MCPIFSFTEATVPDDTSMDGTSIAEPSIPTYESGDLQSIMTTNEDSSVCNKLLLWPSGHYKKLCNHVREALDSGKFIPDDIASMMNLVIACQPLTMDQMGILKYEAAKLVDHFSYSSSDEVMSSDSEVKKHVICHYLIN